MCVIMIVENDNKRPSKNMLEMAASWNSNGGGIAWREVVQENGKKLHDPAHGNRLVKEVVWEKGYMGDKGFEELSAMAAEVPVPYVLHFRIASLSGGGVRPELTHPFPVSLDSSLSLSGKTNGHVFFHNGDWKGWEDVALKTALGRNLQIPTGKWNDSRTMAWLCSIYGLGFMEFLPEQRGVAFGPYGMEVYTGKGWTRLPASGHGEDKDIWCSNDVFMQKAGQRKPVGYLGGNQRVCAYEQCMNISNIDSDGRCPRHPKHADDHNRAQDSKAQAQGVADGNVTPFPQPKAPQGYIISLELAEKFHARTRTDGGRVISTNKIKKIRKYYGMMGQGGKQADRAKIELEMITKDLIKGGLRH